MAAEEPHGTARPPMPEGSPGSAAYAHDWAATPLGPVEGWPQPLKTAAAIALGSNIPMFVVWGPDLLMVHNDSYGELLGDRRPALGRPIREIWADHWETIGPMTRQVMRGETVFLEGAPRTLKRGGRDETAWLTACYNPVYDEAGVPGGIFGAITAVNQDERSEQKLRESEERFRLIANSAPVPMWVTRLDRIRAFVNQAYSDFLGVSAEEALEFDWRTIVHPDDAERLVRESLAGEATLKPFRLEARYRRADGEWRWLRSESQPRWGPDGEHVGFIGIASDITESKLGEEALRELNETLERRVAERTADLSAALDRLQAEVAERERAEEALRQAQKMEAVGQLTGGIAHDFNNLLTPIMGGLEIIARRLDDPRLKRIAETALESSRRGAKLTGQLLAFSRLQRISMAAVDVNRVIANMGHILKPTIGAGIAIATDLSPEVRQAVCDENQLENAILNLVINARDAMPQGGQVTIATRLVRDDGGADLEGGDYVAVSVSDTGEGMPSDVLARAMEPFFSTKPIGKGTGLGLAQVYGIARQSGGTVRLQSEPGSGTEVSILLRAASEEEAESPAGRAVEEAPAPQRQGARISIVDDDAEVRDFLAEALEGLGHRVDLCDCADAALAALDRETPDLMLVDFAMPGMNGAELAREVRERRPELPILFVTGYSESEQLDRALGGSVHILKKPFGVEELAEAVERVLERNG